MPFMTVGLRPRFCRPLKESVGKSRRDAMFIGKLEPIDLGQPIYGRTIVGCAPKGTPTSQLCLPFYGHFTATRFCRRTPLAGWWVKTEYSTVLTVSGQYRLLPPSSVLSTKQCPT